MIRLVTANIKSNPLMRQAYVDADIRTVKGLGDLILWQEIAPARYRSALTHYLDGSHWGHHALNHEIPISYNLGKFEMLPHLSGVLKTHDGKAHTSPARFITYVGLKHRHTAQHPIVVMNTHMVSGAFSANHPFTHKWRLDHWNQHFRAQQALIHSFTSEGITVLGGGDMNRTRMGKYAPEQRWLNSGSIDHLYAVEAVGGTRVELYESHAETRVHTDHDPRIATVSLHRPLTV